MRLNVLTLCIALPILAVLPLGPKSEAEQTVDGIVVDINDARITNATITFESDGHEYTTQTRQDGTYSMQLRAATYVMSIRRSGFWGLRRAPFILEKHSSVRFNFQMWLCPFDMESFITSNLRKFLKLISSPSFCLGDENRERFAGILWTHHPGRRHRTCEGISRNSHL